MFRLNRIRPQGLASRTKARSAAVSATSLTPVMKALAVIAARLHGGSGEGQGGPTSFSSMEPVSVPWNKALPAGRLQLRAERSGLVGGPERPDQRAEIDALGTQIDPLDDGGTIGELVRELALQRLEGGLCLRFAALRGELDHVSAGCLRWYRCRPRRRRLQAR